MSGRDLLYKPPVTTVGPDEVTPGKPDGKKLGLKGARARELGTVEDKAPAAPPRGRAAKVTPRQDAAYKSAYFNKDTSGLGQVNQRARPAQALRGSSEATDLKKIVLPPPMGAETPDPAQLRGASDLMGLEGGGDIHGALTLQNLVARQGAWVRGQGVTVELIKQRLAQLESMIEARKAALARMAKGSSKNTADTRATLDQALDADGAALEHVEDVAGAGTTLIDRVRAEALGLHARLAKVLGIR